jgi:hypothetical protein
VHLSRCATEYGGDEENLARLLIYLHLDFQTLAWRELQSAKINALRVVAHLGEIPWAAFTAHHTRDWLIIGHRIRFGL